MKTQRRWVWPNILFFIFTPLIAAIFAPLYLWHTGLSWTGFLLFLLSFAISNMSITTAYHRYFAHRSFQTSPWVEWVFVFVGSCAFQGSVLQWASDHRRHHAKVDSDNDPYSINKGLWFAHIGWMLEEDPNPSKFAPDLLKSRLLVWQHKYYAYIASTMAFIVPGLLGWAMGYGWGGFIICGVLRVVVSQHSTFFINSLAHYWGGRPYSRGHSARDNWFLAVLTFGEGYHNYHHEFQLDYRNGIRWYQWDPTKWAIRSMAFAGMCRNLKRTAPHDILRARLQIQQEDALAKGACAERLEVLRHKFEDAQTRFRKLREDYQAKKAALQAQSREKIKSWQLEVQRVRREMKAARNEWKRAHAEWKVYVRSFAVARA